MYLGYQKNRIVSYTKTPIDKVLYNLDRIEETQKEYVLDGDEYVLKDESWEEKRIQKEKERIANLKLSKREVFLALYNDCGITPQQIKSGITDEKALIEFEYANEYYRGNPLITTIGASLGYSEEQLDYLFENKKFEKVITGGE